MEVLDFEDVSDFNFNFLNGITVRKHYYQLKDLKKIAGSVHFSPEQIHYGISHIISEIIETSIGLIIVRDKKEVEVAVKNLKVST